MSYQTLQDVITEKYGWVGVVRIQELAREYFEVVEEKGLVAFLAYCKDAQQSDGHVYAMAMVLAGLSTHQWEKVKDSLAWLPAKGAHDWRNGR